MKLKVLHGVCLLALLTCATSAQAQWQNGNLTVRTNGSIFQTGETMRVELVALDTIAEPFLTQVVYAWKEQVEEIEKDEDGNKKTKLVVVERKRERQSSPVFESFAKYQNTVLDDRFSFGDSSPAGWYEVRVDIFQGVTRRHVATVRNLVYHQGNDELDLSSAPQGLFLRGMKRVNNRSFWTFDGVFRGSGDYEILLLRGGKVVRHLRGAGYANGDDEFNLAAAELNGLSGQTFDLLVHDRVRQYTACLTKVLAPLGN